MKETIIYLIFMSILGYLAYLILSITPLDNFKGPLSPTVIRQPQPTSIEVFKQDSPNNLAVLVTDRGSEWLYLANALKTFGIPFTMTTDYKEAIKHKVLLVYPLNWNNLLKEDSKQALINYVKEGGTLISSAVSSEGYNEIFGFKDSTITLIHHYVYVQDTKLFDTTSKEQRLIIGDPDESAYNVSSYDLYDFKGTVLAKFEDGSPAIISQKLNKGSAYAINFDLGEFLAKSYSMEAAEFNVTTGGIDNYDPSVDTIMRWLRTIYIQSEPDAVTIGTVPFNKKFSTIFSHDLDYKLSYPRSIDYAKLEASAHVKATYFLQTKYKSDFNDTAFFNRKAIKTLRKLQEMGMELGSHSVSHSPLFFLFPLGTGTEKFPTYQPMVINLDLTKNGTVLGELRVSKFLIEQVALPGTKVVSFRAGYLLFPRTLPQALEATGYHYDSSNAAFLTRTYFPYRLVFDTRGDTNTNIFEFPVTMDEGETLDERVPVLSADLMIDLGRNLERRGALFIMLIHPNDISKLQYEKKYIEVFGRTSWFGTLKEFGKWWAARDQITIEVKTVAGTKTVQISAPTAITGLTIKVPPTWSLKSTDPDHALKSIEQNVLVFNTIQGIVRLNFDY